MKPQLVRDDHGDAATRAWLHDRVLQALEYIAAGGYAERPDPTLLRRVAASAADELRVFVEQSPRAPDDLGAALAEAIADVQLRTPGLEITLRHAGPPPVLAPEVVDALASAVREALNNVSRHALARRAEVRCTHDRDAVCVTVQDDGAGFDSAAATMRAGLRHSIVGRLLRVGGAARVSSRPGAGTCVTLRVALERGIARVAALAPWPLLMELIG